ncbi:MAG: hypothetical protein ACJAW3_001198 [Lentimonas sp.]
MVKKFNYVCDFNGQKHPVTFYIGHASKDSHPIGFQSKWLAKERGGKVPEELMDSLEKLKELADTQKVPFDELCQYVIDDIKISQENVKLLTNDSNPKAETKKEPDLNDSSENGSPENGSPENDSPEKIK